MDPATTTAPTPKQAWDKLLDQAPTPWTVEGCRKVLLASWPVHLNDLGPDEEPSLQWADAAIRLLPTLAVRCRNDDRADAIWENGFTIAVIADEPWVAGADDLFEAASKV